MKVVIQLKDNLYSVFYFIHIFIANFKKEIPCDDKILPLFLQSPMLMGKKYCSEKVCKKGMRISMKIINKHFVFLRI